MELFNREILQQIGEQILKRNETVAVAESVTAGLLQFAFSNIPDASNFFQGGVTAYNIAQKFKHLNVEPIHALSVNCVSERVAVEMAIQVCEQFKSEWGISITGYATAVPESDGQLYAFFAIVYKGTVKQAGKLVPATGEPTSVQLAYANEVIEKMMLCVGKADE